MRLLLGKEFYNLIERVIYRREIMNEYLLMREEGRRKREREGRDMGRYIRCRPVM